MGTSTRSASSRATRGRTDIKRRAGPRYRQLADCLIEDIRSGRRPVGSTLPGELELMSQFGVSRHTVREALRRLDAIGLIERRRRLGTVVKASEPTETYRHSVRSLADLLQYPSDSRLVKLGVQVIELGTNTARALGCRAGGRWIQVDALRRRGRRGTPICSVEIHLRPELAAVVRDIGRSPLRVFELVERSVGRRVAHVEVDVSAHLLTPHVAALLEVPAGSPSLRIVRRYYDDAGELFEATSSEHPAHRFSFSLDLKREWLRPAEAGELVGLAKAAARQ
jgi:DNA-binding GntR family transcriptional regulator